MFLNLLSYMELTVEFAVKSLLSSAHDFYRTSVSVVTVIETGTETAVFLPNRTEPKPRFYASVLTVRF